MTYFAVDTLKINNQMESLSGIYRELLNEAREIQQLALNLDSDMKKHRDGPFVNKGTDTKGPSPCILE